MKQVITFVRDIPGFIGLRTYTLEVEEANYPFASIQSDEREDVGFVVANPFVFFPNYEIDIPPDVMAELEIDSPDHVQLWGIITYRTSLIQSTMNLQAPVIVNTVNGKAAQAIINEPAYSIRQPLVAIVTSDAEEGGERDAGVNAEKG